MCTHCEPCLSFHKATICGVSPLALGSSMPFGRGDFSCSDFCVHSNADVQHATTATVTYFELLRNSKEML